VRKTLREEFSGQFAEVAKSLRDDLITFKDSILSEIKKLREDVAVITGYKDQIENHETRIEKLEEIIQP
jgi:hypothetical protein